MFIVKKRAGRNEIHLKEFSKEPEAIQFIYEKIREDRHYKIIGIYCLYEGADLIREFSASDVPETSTEGSRQKSGQSFSPTPFNVAPRPSSVPHGWVKDEEDGGEKK